MKTWNEFRLDEPELAKIGESLLFQTRPQVGLGFLATLRKDGAPRLHPVSLVLCYGHLYILIPPTSPKCYDLLRDGRYALQAFPRQNDPENEEFYFSGRAECMQDPDTRQELIDDAKIRMEEDEVLFELLLDRAMYTRLADLGTPNEHPEHRKWRAVESAIP